MLIALYLTIFIYFIIINTGNSIPILNGNDVTDISKYPFTAFLAVQTIEWESNVLTKNWYSCTGIIVSRNAIITAAHCLTDTLGRPNVIVRAGMIYLRDRNSQRANMIDYKIHEEYIDTTTDKDTFNNSIPYLPHDIAFIWLDKNFILTPSLQYAGFNDGTIKIKSNQLGSSIGWGLYNNYDENDHLKDGQMQIISNKCCQFLTQSKIIDEVFCAYDNESMKITPSIGDSGGPFVISNIVVGLTSWGPSEIILNHETGLIEEFPDPEKPSIFLRIDMYLSWITDNAKNGPPKENTLEQPSTSAAIYQRKRTYNIDENNSPNDECSISKIKKEN